MDKPVVSDERIHGLTLYLSGSFDTEKMAEALPLRPIRGRRAVDNTVANYRRDKPPQVFHPSQRVVIDELKLAVEADKSISALFGGLIGAVESLPQDARAAWDTLSERTADLGVDWTNSSNCGDEFDIPLETLRKLADVGIALRISVYGSEKAVERAVSEKASFGQ